MSDFRTQNMIGAGTVLQQRYKIDRQIGQGGMGAVYVSTDERFGSTVAIKETLCNDENFRKALSREARLLNSLKHAALPRVTDHFEENDGLFIVMEYIPGDDLSVILERENKPFPVETVQDWAGQLLDALEFLHTQEMPVVHRDIKPQNLKLTSRGQVILLDFGLAKGNPTDAGHQTAAKSIFGYSRNYASLEQIQGTGTDPRSDLYSLAATLYHLVTGVAPEDALTRAMAVLSKRNDPLVPANSIRPEIPRGFAGVLHKAMDLDASERPASAAEMREMLATSENYAVLADHAPVAVSADASVFAQKTMIMPEATVADPRGTTDLITEVLSEPLSQVTNIRAFADTEPEKPRRKRLAFAAGGLGLVLIGGAVAGGVYMANPHLFGVTPTATIPEQPVVSTELSNTTGTATSLVDNQSTLVANTNTSQPGEAAPDRAKTVDVPAKSADPAKTGQQSPKAADPADGETVLYAVDDNGQPVTMKRSADGRTVTIVSPEGSITTRDGNVIQRRPPPIRRPGVPPPGFDPSKLTPQQRRTLKVILQNPDGQPLEIPNKPTN